MLHPITFSFPEEKVITHIPKKTKFISDLVPGRLETYIYKTETDYYNEYQTSLFATTIKKGGWDCMRHYEIIANGCIPYFPDIEKCPPNTMALLPKDLLIQGNLLYNKYKRSNSLNIPECNEHIQKLLSYMRDHLTTRKMCMYVLDKAIVNPNNIQFLYPQNILFLSGEQTPDYLKCLTLHGFKEVFGSKCHDFPKIPHIYKDNSINYKKLYGKGITYTSLLDNTFRNDHLDKTINEDIRNKKYDLIIYGSYHRGMPFYDIISKIYSPEKIILLCGEDIHKCNNKKWTDLGHTVFVREL